MLELIAMAEDLAAVDTTVLLEGETGTGKELIARIIHGGGRADKPFVAVNCGALPEHLLESELFGHRKGAFTGADRNRVGILESGADGTVLLDEIDKAPLEFQTKLLRVIEERLIRPLGATELVELRARILCAANRDLRELAAKGAFLPDLFYRLSRIRLQLPPLRERREDIRVLIRHFLDRCAGRFGTAAFSIVPAAEKALAAYDWPGNVRELRNAIEGSAFFARKTGVIEMIHLPDEVRNPVRPPKDDTLSSHIEALERRQIDGALRKTGGNKTEAAKLLGISRKGLGDRLRRLGLE
jgi:transcriptional regulator with PAS, ATPase and Fis domain